MKRELIDDLFCKFETASTIINLNGRELLQKAGTISHEMALEKSNDEYKKYKDAQKLIEREKNLKELETDIDTLKKQLPDGTTKK